MMAHRQGDARYFRRTLKACGAEWAWRKVAEYWPKIDKKSYDASNVGLVCHFKESKYIQVQNRPIAR